VIYQMLRERSAFGSIWLLYGARTPTDLLYADEFDQWRNGGIEVLTVVDRGDARWRGQIGVVPTLFSRPRLEPHATRLLTCGPEIMMRFVIFEALARGFRPDRIHLSLERNMNCAVGLCGHCQLGPEFLCKDGPVFTWRRIGPLMRVEDL
jgi:NAD(P)H-flavin reductase